VPLNLDFVQNRNLAFVLAFFAAFIYGISFTISKDVMPLYIKPYGFILLRVSGALLLFWAVSFTIPYEKIELIDFKKIILASIFGVGLNMLTFFKGLSLTTPINGAVMMITSPILVMLFSYLILKEAMTKRKMTGVLLGLVGAALLIVLGKHAQVNAPNIKFGNFLVFVNAASYSLYLIIAKGLLHKYHPIHFAKWMYLFGLFWVFPFGIQQVMEVNWEVLPTIAFLKIGFVVVFTTFTTYLFNILALRRLKPTTLSVFIYLQPLVATIYAMMVGSDGLNWIKIIASLFIFTGIYLVSYRKSQV